MNALVPGKAPGANGVECPSPPMLPMGSSLPNSRRVPLKDPARLEDGTTVEVLGRPIRNDGDNYIRVYKQDYINDLLGAMGLHSCKGSATIGATQLRRPGGAPRLAHGRGE